MKADLGTVVVLVLGASLSIWLGVLLSGLVNLVVAG